MTSILVIAAGTLVGNLLVGIIIYLLRSLIAEISLKKLVKHLKDQKDKIKSEQSESDCQVEEILKKRGRPKKAV